MELIYGCTGNFAQIILALGNFSDLLYDLADLAFSIVKWFVLPIAFLLLLGTLWERYTRRELEKTAFLGKTFVDINGKPIHYVKKGRGNCTVVFQSGMGSSHAIWQEIQDSLSADAVTIAYDRNGIMFSEPNSLPITNHQATEELSQLLEKTKCPKPYVLVGHSMAGIYLRTFIARYKSDIAGIVFAEAAHPEQKEKASPRLLKALRLPPRWFIVLAVNTGIYRSVFSFVPLSAEIPMDHHLHKKERDFFYRSYKKALEELKQDDLNFKDGKRYTDFGNIPLTVIMGTDDIRYAGMKSDGIKREYQFLLENSQHDLLNLSSDSRLMKAANSGHLLQIRDAPLLIAEIRKMIH